MRWSSSTTLRLKLLVALRTSLSGPTAAARQAAALDQLLQGRLLLNVVPGGDARELAADGAFFSHDARYENAEEFLTVWKRLMAGETVDFAGKHVRVEGAKNFHPGPQQPHPALYFGGSSPAAHALAGKHVDAYLTWGEPPVAVAEKIADVRARAAQYGRFVSARHVPSGFAQEVRRGGAVLSPLAEAVWRDGRGPA